MANALEVNESSFREEVLDAGQPVLVDFWAPWCGYCQRLLPIVDELAAESADKMKVVKVNVDENRALAQKYGVMSLPTLVLFKHGEQVEKLLGFMPKANILGKLEDKL